jgi:Fe-S oxidoreductase
MGRIGEWAPLGSRFPGVANAFSSLGISKWLAGMAPGRNPPKFAARTFRSQFRTNGSGEPVVLFDDTFNNHFRPQTAIAAQKLLEAAGCAVQLPARHVCCGRPYYDYGMLDEARRALERLLEVLPLDRPIVVLEPGCLSVFRQAVSLSELLNQRGYKASAATQVFMHAHCHQKALWGTGSELEILRRSGFEVLAPETGCCGMAGSFGYRPQHADTSRRIAGLALLPALDAARDALVVSNGFSCREQIESLAGRPTLHIAELLSPR